jgi:PAS domain S-box-containing protein
VSAAGSAQALGELVTKLGSDRVALAEILDSLAEAVTIRDRNGEIAYANQAATQRMGFSSREELLGQGTQGIMGEYIVTNEQGLRVTAEDIPSVRLLAGETVEPMVMRTVRRSTGDVSFTLLKATLLRDESGQAIAALTIIEDITKEKLAELRVSDPRDGDTDVLTRLSGDVAQCRVAGGSGDRGLVRGRPD